MQAIRKALAVHLSVLSLIFAGLAPLAPSTSFAQSCSYPDDQRLAEAQRECTNNAAKEWRCDLNRCINTGEAQNLREDFKKCAEMPDDTARKKCHDDLAAKESALKNEEDGPNKGLAASAALINGSFALMGVLAGAGASPGGACLSRKIYMAASVVSVLAELYLQFMAEKKLKDFQKKYESEQVQEEAHAAQMRALEYLKGEQELIAKLAKTRKTAYTIQLALYGASAVLALTEATIGTAMGWPLPCLSPEDQAEEDQKQADADAEKAETAKTDAGKADTKAAEAKSQANADAKAAEGKAPDSPEAKKAAASKDASTKASADAKTANSKADARTKTADASAKKAEASKTSAAESSNEADDAKEAGGLKAFGGMVGGFVVGKMLGTSWGIFAVSGVSTVVAGVLMKAASDQMDEANENAGKVQVIIDKFSGVMDSSGYCSPAQRKDLNNPQCYCYENNGDKNMNRTNSQACQALWAQNDQNLMVGAANYDGKKNPNLKVCMLINGQMDRACKCRQMINKTTGQNACMRVPMGSNRMGNIGTALGIPALNSTVGNLAGGNTSFGTLNGTATGKQAIKNRAIADAKIAEYNKQRANDGLPPVDPFSPKLAENMMKKLTPKDFSNASSSLGSMTLANRPKSGALANAIKAADLKSGLSKKSFYTGGRKSRRSSGSSKTDDFAFMNAGGSGGGGKVAGYMDKKYNYKSNDIVKNKGVSIWKVISSRYSKSAMRRLFAEEGE